DDHESRRAGDAVPELRTPCLSAHFAGGHGAGSRWRQAAAGAQPAFQAGCVQRPGRFCRTRRNPGTVRRPRGPRGSRDRDRQPPLFPQPALAVPQFADGRLLCRLRRRDDHAGPQRDRSRRLVRARCAAPAAGADQHLAPPDRCRPAWRGRRGRDNFSSSSGAHMIRWLFYLLALIVMTIVAWIVTPILPAFAKPRMGPIDNNHGQAVEPRLPLWLAWFDTPDNSLLGDSNWKATHDGGYWSQVQWLYRNTLYGFKWGPLAAPMSEPRIVTGDPLINRNNGHFGTMS